MKRARDPKAIEAAMTRRDVTDREVAAVAGCSHTAIQNYVAGRRAVEPAMARKIARFLRQPVGALFVDVVSTSKPSIVREKAVA